MGSGRGPELSAEGSIVCPRRFKGPVIEIVAATKPIDNQAVKALVISVHQCLFDPSYPPIGSRLCGSWLVLKYWSREGRIWALTATVA